MAAIGAPTLLGNAANTTGGASRSETVTTPTAGRLLVCFHYVLEEGNAVPATSVVTNLVTGGWTEIGTIAFSTGTTRNRVTASWGIASGSGTSITITGSDSTPDGYGYVLLQIDANADESNPIVDHKTVESASTTTHTVSTWPAAMAHVDNLGLVGWARNVNQVLAPATGWTELQEAVIDPGVLKIESAWAPGTITTAPAITGANNGRAVGLAVEVRAAVTTEAVWAQMVG